MDSKHFSGTYWIEKPKDEFTAVLTSILAGDRYALTSQTETMATWEKRYRPGAETMWWGLVFLPLAFFVKKKVRTVSVFYGNTNGRTRISVEADNPIVGELFSGLEVAA